MADAKDDPLKKKKRKRKPRVIKHISETVISAKQSELQTKMATSLEAREAVFERDTQYPIDTLADYFANIQEGAKRILPKEKQRFVIYLRKSTDDEQKHKYTCQIRHGGYRVAATSPHQTERGSIPDVHR